MADHDSLRRGGRPRRILQERDFIGSCAAPRGFIFEIRRSLNARPPDRIPRRLAGKLLRHAGYLRITGETQFRPAIAGNAQRRMPQAAPSRRYHRNSDNACIEASEICDEKIETGRKHQQGPIAWPRELAYSLCQRTRRIVQLPEGEFGQLGTGIVDENVCSLIGLMQGAVMQQVRQRAEWRAKGFVGGLHAHRRLQCNGAALC